MNGIRKYVSIALIIPAVSLTISGCASLAGLPIPGFSDSEMNQMGQKTFEDLKKKTPQETDPRINAYVKCVAMSVAREAVDNTGVTSWTVVVFRDATPNAFALPGGYIGVHTGLLTTAKTAGQLAAVLGHEVAHVTARHGKQRVMQNVGLKKVVEVVGGSNEQLGGILGAGAAYGVLLPFSRSHETEADAIGIELMAKAGYDPQESVQLWRNMKAAAGGNKPPEFMSTHPSSDRRIKTLQSLVPKYYAVYKAAESAGKGKSCRR